MFDSGEHMRNTNAFEELLKDSFLKLDFDQPENEGIIQALSDSVMCSNNFQPAKSTNSLKQLLSKISLQSVLWIATGILMSILAICLFTNQQEKNNVKKVVKTTSVFNNEAKTLADGEKDELQQVKKLMDDPIEQSTHSGCVNTVEDTCQKNFSQHTLVMESTRAIEVSYKEDVHPQTEKFEQSYMFPTLTEKEIKVNEKQKKKMSDQLSKLGKNTYPFIPKGNMIYQKAVQTSGGFYMQNHEVTNLEYRTFLFDLLIQNRKQEFLIAKPDQSQWINSNNTAAFDQLKDTYFSDKSYNEHPVVNISVEAAKLYCNWLSELLISRVDPQQAYEIKLPTEIEWIYAARAGLKGNYPWGTDSIQNKYNAFLANFNVQLLKENFNQPFKYMTKFGNPVKLSYTAYTSAGLVLNKDTVATVAVLAYNPNWYGLYCMSGNAAEWTFSADRKFVKALGGSWGSDFLHLKITGENEYPGKKTSPFIGFRFIIIPVEE